MVAPGEREPILPIPEYVPLEKPLGHLVDDILAVRDRGTIRMYLGEAEPEIYNHPDFLAAARTVNKDRGAKFRVITGPVLLVDEKGENGVLTLHEEGVVEDLSHRHARYATQEFRVVETDRIYRFYAEYPHPPLTDPSRIRIVNHQKFHENDWHHMALTQIPLFENWAKAPGVFKTGIPYQSTSIPLLTTVSGLRTILEELKAENKSRFYADAQELMALPSGQRFLRPYKSAT